MAINQASFPDDVSLLAGRCHREGKTLRQRACGSRAERKLGCDGTRRRRAASPRPPGTSLVWSLLQREITPLVSNIKNIRSGLWEQLHRGTGWYFSVQRTFKVLLELCLCIPGEYSCICF